MVAPGSGLPRGRRTLSGTPRPDAQVHHTAGTAAPPVHVSTNWPLTGPRAQEPSEEKNWTTGETGASMNQEEGRASRASALYSAGLRPSQRGAPPIAPPRSRLHLPSRRFQKPLERGRALTPTASRRASTNHKRAALPPSLHTKRRENRREKSAHHRYTLLFPSLRSRRFPTRKPS